MKSILSIAVVLSVAGFGCAVESGGTPVDSEAVGTHEDAIVGGADAQITDFPWQISLQDTDGHHHCGGSIIDERYIVTAQHCFKFGATATGPRDPKSLLSP